MALTGSLTSALDRLRGQAVRYTLQDAERAEYVEVRVINTLRCGSLTHSEPAVRYCRFREGKSGLAI